MSGFKFIEIGSVGRDGGYDYKNMAGRRGSFVGR